MHRVVATCTAGILVLSIAGSHTVAAAFIAWPTVPNCSGLALACTAELFWAAPGVPSADYETL